MTRAREITGSLRCLVAKNLSSETKRTILCSKTALILTKKIVFTQRLVLFLLPHELLFLKMLYFIVYFLVNLDQPLKFKAKHCQTIDV